MDKMIDLLSSYAEKALSIDSTDELRQMNAGLTDNIGDTGLKRLADSVSSLAWELVSMKEELRLENEKRSEVLSEQERTENAMVQRLLDFNLFTYYYQPIVNARTGEIYSYEALMRAVDLPGITPYHILRYAKLSDRLSDVEQYTFLNILHFVDENEELFGGRPVFINSIPSVKVLPEKEEEINALLAKLSDNVVVEMTENSSVNEEELGEIKEKYRRLNVRIAIDDFGSGYSNISNLLRYTPNYVKIDRSLISGVNEDANKKHFVREIIDFCHANDMFVLAEGVETTEELRTVILMDIDLIQGFYTAKPSPEVISALPYDIRAEVCLHRQEREDGKRINVYYADSHEKISLSRLHREGYTRIQIAGFSGGIVTVCGEHRLYTDIHIETADGFSGKIVLQDTVLSNAVGRPVISLGENNDVTMILIGVNKLKNSGICVPESSKLTVEGKGSMDIELGAADYYGIGNDMQSRHGELVFDQDGTISVDAASNSGVCIGSGLGGKISVRRGRYVLNGMGSMNVCVGSLSGSTEIDITGCDMNALANGAYCAVVGSVYGETSVHMLYSSIKCTTDSQLAVGFGTVLGSSSYIYAANVNIGVSINADTMTAFGALNGESDVNIERSSARVTSDGPNALLFGGFEGTTKIVLTDADISADLATPVKICTYAEPEDINVSGGRFRINFNGTEYDRLPE